MADDAMNVGSYFWEVVVSNMSDVSTSFLSVDAIDVDTWF